MIATSKDIAEVRITISDCKSCIYWNNIKPVMFELFRMCYQYTQSIQNTNTSIASADHSTMSELNNSSKILNKIDLAIRKLHSHGVHFINMLPPHDFCAVFFQAMQYEFQEEELGLPIY